MSLTIGDALQDAVALLQKSATPRLDAELLMAFLLKKNRSFVLAYRDQLLTGDQLTAYLQLIERRATQLPIAYLLGEKSFWHFDLEITPDVLVPRSETELLVEKILDDHAGKQEMQVLDLGTGSGAIALALASEKKHWHILAVDISEKALVVAKRNAARLNLANAQVTFLQSDWFRKITPNQKYDVIVSNPPYLAENDPHLIDSEITHEPRLSLVASNHGLAAYEAIANSANAFLNSNGKIYLEHGYEQARSIEKIFTARGYVFVECLQDLSGHDRVSVFITTGDA